MLSHCVRKDVASIFNLWVNSLPCHAQICTLARNQIPTIRYGLFSSDMVQSRHLGRNNNLQGLDKNCGRQTTWYVTTQITIGLKIHRFHFILSKTYDTAQLLTN